MLPCVLSVHLYLVHSILLQQDSYSCTYSYLGCYRNYFLNLEGFNHCTHFNYFSVVGDQNVMPQNMLWHGQLKSKLKVSSQIPPLTHLHLSILCLPQSARWGRSLKFPFPPRNQTCHKGAQLPLIPSLKFH